MKRARLVPGVRIEEIDPASERAVAQALVETLDESWLVFHSYPWLRRSGAKGPLREGEADFVLLHREHGLLVLEVKGGPIEYDAASMTWMRRGEPIKHPFKQAQRNLHALVRQVLERIRLEPDEAGLPCAYGYAVVFPDCDSSGPPPPGGDHSVLLGNRDLPALGHKLKAAARSWGVRPALGKARFEEIKDAILPAFRMAPLLSRRIASDEAVLVRLTEQQQRALEGLYANRRVRVEGSAGSGKTVLAVERARRFAQQGQRTLLLCFNRRLAADLRAKVDQADLTVRHFHGLCAEWCKGAGIPFAPPADSVERARWFVETAPELMAQAIERSAERFDAVVVDEAQDFAEDWWPVVEWLCAEEEGPLYIFYDRTQNIFGADLVFPATRTGYTLPANCRNTREIAQACGRVIDTPIQVWDHAPAGSPPKVLRYQSGSGCRGPLLAEIKRLLQDGLKPSQIAVLGPLTRSRSSLGMQPASVVEFTEDLRAWRAGEAVFYSSAKAFKGLEADAVLLIDLETLDQAFFGASDLYVACSRAKHELVAFTCSDEIARRLEGAAT